MKFKTMEKLIVALNATMVVLTLTIIGLTVSLVHDMNEQEKARQYRWGHQFDNPFEVIYKIETDLVGDEKYYFHEDQQVFWKTEWAEQICTTGPQAQPTSSSSEANTYEVPLSQELQEFIASEVEESGVISLPTFYALMYHESRFIPTAVSDTDDYGLCQINTSCLPYLKETLGISTVEELYDAKTNVKASLEIMEFMASYARDEYQLLSMYHMGVEGYYSWAEETGNYATTPAWEIMELRENFI